ncbi:MAG: putative integral rane export protein [Actinomycetia bacterium]|nr:putative integral rane export protein [Actinomycetes bacterium]
MKTLARFCYRRRWLVLLLWIAGAAAVITVGFGFAAPADNNFAGGKADSALAGDVAAKHFPHQGDSLTLAVHADRGITDPAAKAKIDGVLTTLRSAPDIASVTSPYAAPNQVSRDGRTAFAQIFLTVKQDKVPVGDTSNLIASVRGASGDGVVFALDGGAVQTAETPYGGSTEGIGLLAAMIILLVAFGSLPAMGLPIVTAMFGIGTGLALTDLIGYVFPAPSFSPIVAGLIGLGVGVDYALFIVTRYREGLEDGLSPEEATVKAIATSGRSVLFAGVTVVIAMLGLLVMQQSLLTATAIAASVAVLMTMITAITLLPALLGFTGHNINRFRLPLLGRTRTASPLAIRWAGVIQRRPVISLVSAGAVLLILAVPALSMRLSFEDSSNLPKGSSGYTANHILASGFGAGYDAPLFVIAESGTGLQPVADAVRRTPGIASVTPVFTSPDGGASQFLAYPTTAQQDAATPKLVTELRDNVIPGATTLTVHVGGPNAGTVDFADAVGVRLPWLIAIVIGLSLVILLALVRSVTIAVKAALMTLLSIGAAYGVLTAIVQWGWGGKLLGFPVAMPVTTWVPLFMFPILFGLSTDYEVFLIARIREEYDALGDTREAVTQGLARTARVITAAAAIMVMVFLTVLLGSDPAVKQFGLGLAIAVFVDATVVRMVLVPALMELLGAWNWWLPRPLARLLPATVH